MNSIVIQGRLTKDPEYYEFKDKEGGVANFTLAVNDKYNSENSDFINCKAFDIIKKDGTTFNAITQFCKKGHRLVVQGRLKQENFKDKDGNERSTYKVLVESVTLIETKKEAESQTQQTQTEVKKPVQKLEEIGDDLP
jgi:single-strand DNA-binding protein